MATPPIDPTDPRGSTPPADEPRGEGATLSRGELQDRAIHGALWTILHTLVSLPLAFVVNIVIARLLGVVDYGRLAYLTTVLTLVGGVAALGVGTGVMQFGAKAHAMGRTDEVRQLLSASQGFRLLVTMPALVVAVLAVSDIAAWPLAVAILFGVVLPSVFGSAPACFGIENKTAQGAQNAMIVNLLTQAVVVVTVLAVPTADAVWVARLAMGGLAVVMAFPYVSPLYRRAVLVPSLPRGFPAGFWRFSLPAGAAGAVGALVASRSEVLVLTWMSAVEAAGIFAMAFGLASHLFGPAQALLGPLVPAVAGLREVDEAAVGRALARTLRASATIVGLLVGTAIPALAHLVVPIYGPEYAEVPEVLLALGIAGGVMVVVGPGHAFVQARLSGVRMLVANLAAVAVDVVLLVALVPSLGVWGAVVGNVAAALTQLVLLLGGELRSVGLTWGSALRSGLPVVLGGGGGLAAWLVTMAFGWEGVLGASVSGILGAVLILAALRVTRTGLSHADADAVARSVPGRLRPLATRVLALCIGVPRESAEA